MKDKISIIGLGYVGLPLAVSLSNIYHVYGFEVSNNRIEELKKGIDKSSFRKSLGRNLKLKPGNDTCNYIFSNLQLKILTSDEIETIKQLEIQLITQLNPIFNTTYKSINLQK